MEGRSRWGVTALVLAALVVGCGGSEDGDETSSAAATISTAPGLSKDEWVERADAICGKVNKQMEGEERRGETLPPEEEAGQAAAFYTVMIGELKEVGVPEDAEGYSELLAAMEELKAVENAYDRELEFGDEAKLPSLQAQASSALASFRAAAREYGSEECGEGPPPQDLGV